MAYKIAQFRYYGSKNSNNYSPFAEVNSEDFNFDNALTNGKAFQDCVPIYKIGIQTFPGATIHFNKNTYPVMVGKTGIFELELDDNIKISSINIDVNTIDMINKVDNYYLIIDVIYEGGNS